MRVVELLMLIHSNDAMIEGRSQEFLEITPKKGERIVSCLATH